MFFVNILPPTQLRVSSATKASIFRTIYASKLVPYAANSTTPSSDALSAIRDTP